jgi:hypothetical protein
MASMVYQVCPLSSEYPAKLEPRERLICLLRVNFANLDACGTGPVLSKFWKSKTRADISEPRHGEKNSGRLFEFSDGTEFSQEGSESPDLTFPMPQASA